MRNKIFCFIFKLGRPPSLLPFEPLERIWCYMEFKPVSTSRLYEEVVEQIKKLIEGGKIKPGDKFPPERQLASTLNVSRGVLREAFRVLESRGLVKSKRGGGRFLRDFNKQNIFKSGNNFLNLEKAALLDIAEARLLIETQIIKLATREATDKDIEKISSILIAMEDIDNKGYDDTDLDLEFHLAIARATHNFALHDLLEAQIHLLIQLEQKRLLDRGERKKLCDEHKEILNGIIARDEKFSSEVMENHLNHLIKAIKKINLESA